MAQQTTVMLTDDIDGGKAVETVSFGLDGKHYEIDLGAKNAKNLRKAVAAYVDAGRKVRNTGNRSAAAKTATRSGGSDLAAIRAWARTRTASQSRPAAVLPRR